jgi:hypothetical protein
MASKGRRGCAGSKAILSGVRACHRPIKKPPKRVFQESNGAQERTFRHLPDFNTLSIWIYSDVNGGASIPAFALFAIGEIFVGRMTGLPLLLPKGSPGESFGDPTTTSTTSGSNKRPLMRKVLRSIAATLVPFTDEAT